ncbi:MFS transporter, partial [Enterobacter hormaechei]|nr:MFS transporter [Enterobacter hormaechei]
GALADNIGFSQLFEGLAGYDMQSAVDNRTEIQNKHAIEDAQETHKEQAPQH